MIVFLAQACAWRNHLADTNVSTYRMDGLDEPAPSSRIDSIISPYREKVSAEMEHVIGEVESILELAKPEGTLNNWMTDAMARSAAAIFGRPVDFALQNYGGIRLTSIPAGPITVGKIYEVMPFDNTLVLVVLDSANVKQLCDVLASHGGEPSSQGLKYGILEDEAHLVMINGKPLSGDRNYYIAVPDYIVYNTSTADILRSAPREGSQVLIRDALIMDVRRQTSEGRKIRGVLDGRVYFVND